MKERERGRLLIDSYLTGGFLLELPSVLHRDRSSLSGGISADICLGELICRESIRYCGDRFDCLFSEIINVECLLNFNFCNREAGEIFYERLWILLEHKFFR